MSEVSKTGHWEENSYVSEKYNSLSCTSFKLFQMLLGSKEEDVLRVEHGEKKQVAFFWVIVSYFYHRTFHLTRVVIKSKTIKWDNVLPYNRFKSHRLNVWLRLSN